MKWRVVKSEESSSGRLQPLVPVFVCDLPTTRSSDTESSNENESEALDEFAHNDTGENRLTEDATSWTQQQSPQGIHPYDEVPFVRFATAEVGLLSICIREVSVMVLL